jgi:hypothetical protein
LVKYEAVPPIKVKLLAGNVIKKTKRHKNEKNNKVEVS